MHYFNEIYVLVPVYINDLRTMAYMHWLSFFDLQKVWKWYIYLFYFLLRNVQTLQLRPSRGLSIGGYVVTALNVNCNGMYNLCF